MAFLLLCVGWAGGAGRVLMELSALENRGERVSSELLGPAIIPGIRAVRFSGTRRPASALESSSYSKGTQPGTRLHEWRTLNERVPFGPESGPPAPEGFGGAAALRY